MREALHGVLVAAAFAGACVVVLELLPQTPDKFEDEADLAQIDRYLERSARIQEILAQEPKQAWKQIAWLRDAAAARARAAAERKPILTVMMVNEHGQKHAERCCLGGRLFVSGALSDPAVIELVQVNFVPLMMNLTLEDVPEEMPAIQPWDLPIKSYPEFSLAFSTSTVSDATGQAFFGNSGRSYPPEYEPDGRYLTAHYLAFLQQCLQRYRDIQALDSAANLTDAQRNARRAALLASYRKELQPLSMMGPASGPGVTDAPTGTVMRSRATVNACLEITPITLPKDQSGPPQE